jgi:hypothetical protein
LGALTQLLRDQQTAGDQLSDRPARRLREEGFAAAAYDGDEASMAGVRRS